MLIGLIIRLIIYILVGLLFLALVIAAASQRILFILGMLFVFLLISVPISVLELRYASHKRRTGQFPVVYYQLQQYVSRQELVAALDRAVCSGGAWQSETGRQADTPHFWNNIATGERIFVLITPFFPLIIALGHMSRQGSGRTTTKSIRDALARAEQAARALMATRVPNNQVIPLLGTAQGSQVQRMTTLNEVERLSQSKTIKSCPKCRNRVYDLPRVIECPFCLYRFGLNDDIQQQKRKATIEQQIAFISKSAGGSVRPQANVRALPPMA